MLTVKVDVSALREDAPKMIIVEVPLASKVEELTDFVVKDIQNGDKVEADSLHFWTRTGKRLHNKYLLRRTRPTDQPFLVAEVSSSCSKPVQSDRSELQTRGSSSSLINGLAHDHHRSTREKKSRKTLSGVTDSEFCNHSKKKRISKAEKTIKRKLSDNGYLDSRTASNNLVKTGEGAIEIPQYETCKPDVREVFQNGSNNPDRLSPSNRSTIFPTQSNADIVKFKDEMVHSATEVSTNHMSEQDMSCCDGNDDSDDDIQIIDVTGEETVTNQQIVYYMTGIFQRYQEKRHPRSPTFEVVMKKLQEAYPQNMNGREAMVKTVYEELLQSCPKRNRAPKVEAVVGCYKLTEEDFATLQEGCWLNDNIINAYLYLLTVADPTGMVYAFSTFFYPTLLKKGYNSIKKWTRKENLFKYRLLLVPVHLNNHWTMALINIKSHMIQYYDSVGSKNPTCLKNLKKFMVLEANQHQNPKWMLKTWKTSTVEGTVPRQTISGDCGVFACQFARCMVARNSAEFHQNEMPQIRQQMISEIHEGEVAL
ncbi:sentrin-specific protease 1-like [Anneissia japonica]|uniref:sentrin-specific protease 1-like n=1 Tax=Anneissia japonica TaxID=1529436 RepID=UPI0014254C15|nr:sentrin-specific protease 1-like [Anneissia japonica]